MLGIEGALVGGRLGCGVGFDGNSVGLADGATVGPRLGTADGGLVGDVDGTADGCMLGTTDGVSEGRDVE
jgi:hypothetical protein